MLPPAQTAADHPTRRIRDLRAEGPSECVGTSTPEGRLGYFRAQTGPLLSAGRGVLHGAKGLTERLRADFIDRACRPPMLAKQFPSAGIRMRRGCLKTAKALGLTMPQSIQIRADKIIQ